MPDEFAVVSRAPLAIPPDFSLRPPRIGAQRPQEQATVDQARQTVFRAGEDAKSNLPPAAEQRSPGEDVLLRDAGAAGAPSNIRQLVDTDASSSGDLSDSFVDKLAFWRPKEQKLGATDNVIDPAQEAERLKDQKDQQGQRRRRAACWRAGHRKDQGGRIVIGLVRLAVLTSRARPGAHRQLRGEMRHRALGWSLVLALAAVRSMTGAPAQAKMFDAESFTLGNGLQVVVLPNHRAPIATQMIWYKAGAADETPGKTGVAHFLEHLMFRGTKETPPGAFSRIVAANGGRDNAFTTHDYTAFFQNVAADRLPLVDEARSASA